MSREIRLLNCDQLHLLEDDDDDDADDDDDDELLLLARLLNSAEQTESLDVGGWSASVAVSQLLLLLLWFALLLWP